MKKLIMVSALLIVPIMVTAATYINKTSKPLIISKKRECVQGDADTYDLCQDVACMKSDNKCTCLENDPCMKIETQSLLVDESIDFENDQDQPITIICSEIEEKREFYPTNDNFKYEITISKFPSRFSKITINHAQ